MAHPRGSDDACHFSRDLPGNSEDQHEGQNDVDAPILRITLGSGSELRSRNGLVRKGRFHRHRGVVWEITVERADLLDEGLRRRNVASS